jgi:hypothetical protein
MGAKYNSSLLVCLDVHPFLFPISRSVQASNLNGRDLIFPKASRLTEFITYTHLYNISVDSDR